MDICRSVAGNEIYAMLATGILYVGVAAATHALSRWYAFRHSGGPRPKVLATISAPLNLWLTLAVLVVAGSAMIAFGWSKTCTTGYAFVLGSAFLSRQMLVLVPFFAISGTDVHLNGLRTGSRFVPWDQLQDGRVRRLFGGLLIRFRRPEARRDSLILVHDGSDRAASRILREHLPASHPLRSRLLESDR